MVFQNYPEVVGSAVLLTSGSDFTSLDEKTGHGLIDASFENPYLRRRFNLLGVIGTSHMGEDAGLLQFGRPLGVKFFNTVRQLLATGIERPDFAVVGSNTPGGFITPTLRTQIQEALELGISVVNGLREHVEDDPQLVDIARQSGARIIDLRQVLPAIELPSWNPTILECIFPRVWINAEDSAAGKRTTTRLVTTECRRAGIRAVPVFTGATGLLQTHPDDYVGCQLDTVADDFTGGVITGAVLEAKKRFSPDIVFIEGQGTHFHPSSPGGSENILSAGAKYSIFQHTPGLQYYEGFEDLENGRIKPLENEIELTKLYGAQVIAITLNTRFIDPQELPAIIRQLENKHGIPVFNPRQSGPNGTDGLLDVIKEILTPDVQYWSR